MSRKFGHGSAGQFFVPLGLVWGSLSGIQHVNGLPEVGKQWPAGSIRPIACFYEVLLGHRHAHLCIIHGCFHPTMAEMSSPGEDCMWPKKPKMFATWAFTEKSADPQYSGLTVALLNAQCLGRAGGERVRETSPPTLCGLRASPHGLSRIVTLHRTSYSSSGLPVTGKRSCQSPKTQSEMHKTTSTTFCWSQ